MVLVPRACLLLLPLLLGTLGIPTSTPKQVSQVRGGRATGWSGDRPVTVRQLSHPRPPPPSPLPALPVPPPPSHTRPPPADRAARTRRNIARHDQRPHSPSSPSVNTHRERRFRSTHRGTTPQTKSLRRSRNRPAPDRKAKNNRGSKKARRKQKLTTSRPDVASDAARASYVISDIPDTDQQTGLREAPYLSPSFIRPNDQGKTFRHYSAFDHYPQEDGAITEAGEPESPLNQAALGSRASRQTGIIDSDTIVKDGQIFHRHDAREDRKGISRGQSRRRHARPGDQQTLFDEALQRDVGQIGVTKPGGFFTAEALNSGGHSQTRVAGNVRGVDGSAVTLSGGKVTQAAVTLGENASSTAQITDHHGADDPILASTVGADQRGGSADARGRASDATTTHAQIEFSPTNYDEAEQGEHGTASALFTPNGESTLATLGGLANHGSYLGTAHSSTLQEPYPAHHAQVQPSFESEATQGLRGNKSHKLIDMSDMLGSIMETVHQPHVLPQVAPIHPTTLHLFPPESKLIPAKEGLVGGTGDAPQESEIGRVTQQLYEEQEGDGRHVAPPAAGQVGIATYFQGELGALPDSSNFTGLLSEDYEYDPSMYYDMDLDLDSRVFRVEPLELDFGTLYPTPAPPLQQPQQNLTFHSPAVVHQLQTTTPDIPPSPSPPLEPHQQSMGTEDNSQTPDQPHSTDYSLSPDLQHTPDQPHIPDYSYTPGQPHIPDYSYTPGQPHIPDYSYTPGQPHIPDYSYTPGQPHIPDYSYTPGQPHIPDYSYTPGQPHIPDYSYTPGQPHIPDYSYTPSQPHIPDYSYTPGQPHIPDYSYTPGQPHIPDYSYTPDHSQTPDQPHIPDYSYTPDHSQTPDQPRILVHSQTPDQPHIPVHSQTPDQPHIPDHSQIPDQPHIPDHSQTPDQPHIPDHSPTPDHSQTPDQPHIPDHSQTPDQPHIPVHSQTPDLPHILVHSQTPDQPHIPVHSQTPDQPQIPVHSQTPDHPHIPDYSQTQDHSQIPGQPHIPDHSQTPDQPYIPDYSFTPDQPHTLDLSPGQPHLPDQTGGPDHLDIPAGWPPIPGSPHASDPLPALAPHYSRTQDHIPDYSQTLDPPHIPDYSQPPTYSQIPDQAQTDHHTPRQPSAPLPLPRPEQHQTASSLPTLHHGTPAQPSSSDQTNQRETNQPPVPRPSDTRVSGAAPGNRGSTGSVQTMPMGVPLVPGPPDSTQTLPNGDDGPILNVITMPNKGMDMSMMHQRTGVPIQPGEKIPGAPRYSIPAGFRGHVILGHTQPVEASSQLVVEGFDTQVNLTPQSPASGTVFASVSSPHASQQLTSEGGVPGIHVTLGGGGDSRQQYRAPDRHHSMTSTGDHSSRERGTSMRGNQWHSTDSHQWTTRPASGRTRPSHRDQSGANDWRSDKARPSVTSTADSWNRSPSRSPSKSWNGRQISPQQRGRRCPYIIITCKVMVNNLGQTRQCRPSYTTRDCCC